MFNIPKLGVTSLLFICIGRVIRLLGEPGLCYLIKEWHPKKRTGSDVLPAQPRIPRDLHRLL